MKTISKPTFLLLTLLALGCSEWGTSLLRPVDIWWACRDKSACSSEDAQLTYIQMVNTLAGVQRDLLYAERNCPRKANRLHLRELYARAVEAQLNASPRAWTDGSIDFAQKAVAAERASRNTWGCGQ